MVGYFRTQLFLGRGFDQVGKVMRSCQSVTIIHWGHAKSYPKYTPKAMKEDVIRPSIPPGYSKKNWDPTEVPIILLGGSFHMAFLGVIVGFGGGK
jgi:hypothetical protein